jgi:hypothetical protein
MKVLRTAAIALIGISLSTPSAHACELDLSFFTWIYQIMHPQPDSHDNRGGDNRGGNGRDCNRGGSGGGSTSGGGSSSGGGSTTSPVSPKS